MQRQLKWISRTFSAFLFIGATAALCHSLFTQPASAQPKPLHMAMEFSVGSGPLRTIDEAQEYCAALGMRLPTPTESEVIYQQTLNSRGVSALANYDGNETTGTFWTSLYYRTAGSFFGNMTLSCPVQFEILDRTKEKNQKPWRLQPVCYTRPKPTALTICVAPLH